MKDDEDQQSIDDRRDRRSVFERHAQTIVGSVLLALLLWSGNTLLDVRDRLGRIEVLQVNGADRAHDLAAQMAALLDRVRAIELRDAAGKNPGAP